MIRYCQRIRIDPVLETPAVRGQNLAKIVQLGYERIAAFWLPHLDARSRAFFRLLAEVRESASYTQDTQEFFSTFDYVQNILNVQNIWYLKI